MSFLQEHEEQTPSHYELNSSKDDQGIEEFGVLEYLAQEFTPFNTIDTDQKVPSEFWVPGVHTISFNPRVLLLFQSDLRTIFSF